MYFTSLKDLLSIFVILKKYMSMKKFLMPFIICLFSCTSEYTDVQGVDENAKIIKISIGEMNSDIPDSRWVYDESNNNKFAWKSNDVLGIFPYLKGSLLEFPVDLKEGEIAESVMFDGGGWAFKAGYTYSAYSPYNKMSNRGTQIPFSYAKQRRIMNGNHLDLCENMLMVAPPTPVENNSIYFLFYPVEAMFRIDLYGLPADKTYKSLALYAESAVIPQEKVYNIFSMKVDGKTVTIEDENISVADNLKIDLQNATPDVNTSDGKMIRVWMGFPAIGNSYGSLTALVEDSEGNLYTGEVLSNVTGYPPYRNEIKRNTKVGLRVYLKSTNGVTGSIENWEPGEVILGSAE